MLLKPEDWPAEIAAGYRAACKRLGVEPFGKGYGLVLALDRGGGRWTRITRDVGHIDTFLASEESGIACGLDLDAEAVVADLPGWPMSCDLRLVGVPEPRDPVTDRRPILRPPTGDTAREAAHTARVAELARELQDYRPRALYEQTWLEHAHNMGDHDPGPVPVRLVDLAREPEPEHRDVAALSAALAAAEADEPSGVQVGKAAYGGARVIRLALSDWTVLARVPDGPCLAVHRASGQTLDIVGLDGVPDLLRRLAGPGG
ncbi:hypothetical protein [Embleya sp. NBC_00896]|uniref:hypothetical protein n=1 Tax=Embleya sp. NBC_00896 TaxID=2975961 RepID=UPI00386553C2|nr:hypothetical protein OG928_45110 [Embleya sp. NBC_00896]